MSDAGHSLCLSCGICCDGTLFSNAPVNAAEPIKEFRRMGLPIEQSAAGRFSWPLPCSQFNNGKCQIYDSSIPKPRTCSAFRCSLLRNVETRKTALPDARRIVQSALRMRSRIRSLWGKHCPDIPLTPPMINAIRLVRERSDSLAQERRRQFALTHGEFLVACAAFDSCVRTHFTDPFP